jgi:hypothetical protein
MADGTCKEGHEAVRYDRDRQGVPAITHEERAAMKERAHELKAAARRGPRAGKADRPLSPGQRPGMSLDIDSRPNERAVAGETQRQAARVGKGGVHRVDAVSPASC